MPRSAKLAHRLDRIATGQDGVATRLQLASLGIDGCMVDHRVRTGKWQAATPSVVVLHNGPLTRQQHAWIAVLAQSGPAAVGGVTAAQFHGLLVSDDSRLHVVVPKGSRVHRLPGVRIHESRRFTAEDIHPVRTPPLVRLDRAVVDAAAWSRDARVACGLFARAVQQRLTTSRRLATELDRAGAIRHVRVLRAILGDIDGGAQSFAEIDFVRLARSAGLPPPVRQAFRIDRAGRRRWLDVDFEKFSAEIDGAVHLRPLTYWEDMDRQNDLVVVTGRPMLRFSTVAIRLSPDTVMAQLRAAAARFR